MAFRFRGRGHLNLGFRVYCFGFLGVFRAFLDFRGFRALGVRVFRGLRALRVLDCRVHRAVMVNRLEVIEAPAVGLRLEFSLHRVSWVTVSGIKG